MKVYQTCEELQKELLAKPTGFYIILTLRKVLKLCRKTNDPRLHQSSLEKKRTAIDKLEAHFASYGMRLVYLRELDVFRGKEMLPEDEVLVSVKSGSEEPMDILLKKALLGGSFLSTQETSSYSRQDEMR